MYNNDPMPKIIGFMIIAGLLIMLLVSKTNIEKSSVSENADAFLQGLGIAYTHMQCSSDGRCTVKEANGRLTTINCDGMFSISNSCTIDKRTVIVHE